MLLLDSFHCAGEEYAATKRGQQKTQLFLRKPSSHHNIYNKLELFLLRIPRGHCEVSLFVFWSLCVSQGVKSSISHEFFVEITWECRSQGMQELQGWCCTEWARLCHLQVCVQGQPEAGTVLLSLVTALWQWLCWSKWATILSSIFVLAGIVPALSFEPTARQGPVIQLRETPVPYSAKHQVLLRAVIARKTLTLMHPSPEETCFTGRSCFGGVWGGFYCWLGLSSSCSAGLSVSV